MISLNEEDGILCTQSILFLKQIIHIPCSLLWFLFPSKLNHVLTYQINLCIIYLCTIYVEVYLSYFFIIYVWDKLKCLFKKIIHLHCSSLLWFMFSFKILKGIINLIIIMYIVILYIIHTIDIICHFVFKS